MKCFAIVLGLAAITISGCDADRNRPDNAPSVEVRKSPDLDPKTDDDVDVKLPDVDVNVHREPGKGTDVDIDVAKPADADTKANEDEAPGTDK